MQLRKCWHVCIHETITTKKTVSRVTSPVFLCKSLPLHNLLPSCHSIPSLRQITIRLLSFSMEFTCICRVLYKWNHTVCTLFIWLLSLSINILRFTRVAVCITGLFSFLAEQHSIVYIYNNLLIHSPVYGTLSSFQFGAVANKAAMSIHVPVFV